MGAAGDAASLWEPRAQHYRSVAKDAETESADLVRAALLYVAAERHLSAGDTAAALATAGEALGLFRSLEVKSGLTDAVHLITHMHCLQDERKEASRLVLEELNRLRLPDDAKARAKLLMASAELNCEGRGNRKREEAMQAAREAQAIFKQFQDRHQEGMALLAQVAICSKTKCTDNAKGQEMLRLAREAQPIFKGLGEKTGEALTLHWVGVAFALEQMYQDAINAAIESKELFQKAGDTLLQALEAQCLSLWQLKEQDPERAVEAAEEALTLVRDLGCRGVREASAAQALVRAHIANGDGQSALTAAQGALSRAQVTLDREMEVEALLLVSESYLHLEPSTDPLYREDLRALHCPLEALGSAERALALVRDLKDEQGEARIMALLADLHARRQDFEQASATAHPASRGASGKDLEAEGAALQALASSHLAKGEYQEAMKKAQEARALFSRRHAKGEASSLLLMGQISFEQGRVDQAVADSKEAQVLYQEMDDGQGIGEALAQVAEFRTANQEHARALHAADRARVHAQRYGDKATEARMLLLAAQSRAFLLVRKREAAEAEERKAGHAFAAGWEEIAKATGAARQAVKLSEELGDARGMGNALCIIAQVYIFTQRLEHALAAADEAILRFVEAGDVRGEASALVLQAHLHMALGNLKKSLSLARQGLLIFQQADDLKGEAVAGAVLASLRQHEFIVDERAATVIPSLPADSEQLAMEESQNAVATQLDASYVADTIQQVTRKMVGAGEESIISADNPLMDIGITSMNAVLFRNKLGSEFESMALPTTLVFDFPTIRDLTSFIIEHVRV